MNRKSYFDVSLGITLICLWFFLIYSPFKNDNNTLSQRIKETEAKLADFEHTIDMLPDFIARRELLKKKKDFLNSRLYTKEEVVNLFNRLKEQAANWNLTVTEITPPIEELLYLNSIIPNSNQPQFLNIGVHVHGEYIDFGKFMDNIEQEPYFRGVNGCRISGSRDFNRKLDMYVGFKALLGRIGEQS